MSNRDRTSWANRSDRTGAAIFLLVYDHRLQKLIEQREFADGEAATKAYAALEAEHRARRDLEIVLVGADSIATIMQTHGHYFDATEDVFPLPAGVR